MTAHLLASELANLIQESKRKHNDLRQVRGVMRTVYSGGHFTTAHSNAAHYKIRTACSDGLTILAGSRKVPR